MATRTIANAGGNWSATGTWVEGAIPLASDDVVATATSGQLTLSASGAVCRSLDFTNYVNTFTMSIRVVIIGDGTAGAGNVALKLVSGMTISVLSSAGGFTFASSSATQQTIDLAGKAQTALIFNGAGSSYLINGTAPATSSFNGVFTVTQGTVQSNVALNAGNGTLTLTAGSFTCTSSTIICGAVTHTSGTLDLTGTTLTGSGVFTSSNSNVRTLTITNGTVTCAGWTLTTVTNLTLNATGSTVNITGSSTVFAGGGKTYATVGFQGSSQTVSGSNQATTINVTGSSNTISGFTGAITTMTISGASNTINALTITTLTVTGNANVLGTACTITTLNNNTGNTASGLLIAFSTTQTITNIATNSTMATGRAKFGSNSGGVTATISTSGTNSTDALIIQDITRTGAGTWTTSHSQNVSNNSGITFTAIPRLIATTTGNITGANFAKADATMVVDSENSTTVVGSSPTTTGNSTLGVITVDGVALKLSSRVASPTGTFAVTLRNTTGSLDVSTVTVNVSDLKVSGGWHFFKFSGNVLTLAATSYAIKVVCSVASEVILFRSATTDDLTRLLRTTTADSIGPGVQVLICNELTGAGTSNAITITANMNWIGEIGLAAAGYVDSLAVSGGGTLTWGVSASTTYLMTVRGLVSIWSGSTWNRGTSGSPMPSTSTGSLSFSITSNDGGFVAKNGSTVNEYGNVITTKSTLLTVDAAAAATSLTVASTSGWAINDLICFASTSQTASQFEERTIATVPTGTTFTITAGLTNAHSGTSPTQGEVLHLTRNLKTYGSGTATGQAYVRFDPTATVNESYVEFYQLGAGATDKMGIDIETTTGSCTMTGCVYRDSSDASTDKLYISGASSNNITLSYCNFAQSTTQGYGIKVDATTGTSITIDNCLVVGWLNGIVCGDVGITLTNCTVSGAQPGVGIGAIQIGEAGAAITGTFNNLTAHGNAYSGVEFSQQQISGSIGTINAWRNLCNNGNASDSGIKISAASYGLTFTGGTLFGNGGSTHSSGICITAGATPTELTFRNFTMCGDTTFPNQQAITLGGYYGRLFLEGCQLGVPTGIYTTHTSGDIPASTTAIPVNYILRNTTLGSPTEIINQSSMNAATSTYIVSEKHDQTAGLHYRWERNGTVNTDSSLFKTASPSLKMTPTSASIKLTATRYPFHFSAPVSSGQTITFTCYVQKSAAYNGAQPRLLVIENAAIGITVDTVLSTASGGLGSWLTLTGTTAAVTDDGVLEFTVDCDGTAGFVNVDDCSVSGAALDTTGLKYWFDGQPFVSGPAPIGAAAAAAKLVGFGGGLVS